MLSCMRPRQRVHAKRLDGGITSRRASAFGSVLLGVPSSPSHHHIITLFERAHFALVALIAALTCCRLCRAGVPGRGSDAALAVFADAFADVVLTRC